MAHSISAKKRIRQNETRRNLNRARKSALKTQIRKFEDALRGDNPAAAEQAFRQTVKQLDQVAATSAMHKNAASRKKSRLAKKLNAIKQKTAG